MSTSSWRYPWWLGRSLLNGREVHWARALGRGGQSIRVVPELNLVVVVTAGYYQDYSPSVSSAVRHFQGHLAGDFASGLNWKRRTAALDWSDGPSATSGDVRFYAAIGGEADIVT